MNFVPSLWRRCSVWNLKFIRRLSQLGPYMFTADNVNWCTSSYSDGAYAGKIRSCNARHIRSVFCEINDCYRKRVCLTGRRVYERCWKWNHIHYWFVLLPYQHNLYIIFRRTTNLVGGVTLPQKLPHCNLRHGTIEAFPRVYCCSSWGVIDDFLTQDGICSHKFVPCVELSLTKEITDDMFPRDFGYSEVAMMQPLECDYGAWLCSRKGGIIALSSRDEAQFSIGPTCEKNVTTFTTCLDWVEVLKLSVTVTFYVLLPSVTILSE